jgi:TPR repeat protein
METYRSRDSGVIGPNEKEEFLRGLITEDNKYNESIKEGKRTRLNSEGDIGMGTSSTDERSPSYNPRNRHYNRERSETTGTVGLSICSGSTGGESSSTLRNDDRCDSRTEDSSHTNFEGGSSRSGDSDGQSPVTSPCGADVMVVEADDSQDDMSDESELTHDEDDDDDDDDDDDMSEDSDEAEDEASEDYVTALYDSIRDDDNCCDELSLLLKIADGSRNRIDTAVVQRAQALIAILFWDDEVMAVPSDLPRAHLYAARSLDWLRSQAGRNDAWAQYWLGVFLEEGVGTASDESSAVKFYTLAAAADFHQARLRLAWYQERHENYEEMFRWFSVCAENDDAYAQHELSLCYSQGKGVARNDTEAFRWSLSAAQQEYVPAQVFVGKSYLMGSGVISDAAAAVQWFRQASDAEDADGQFWLAKCYFSGVGVPANLTESVRLNLLAATQGHKLAMCVMGMFSRTGIATNGVRDYVDSVEWYKLSEMQNCEDAWCPLGEMYERGLGVVKDKLRAFAYYSKAADAQRADGQYRLGRCFENGIGVDRNMPMAMTLYHLAAKQGYRHAVDKIEGRPSTDPMNK